MKVEELGVCESVYYYLSFLFLLFSLLYVNTYTYKHTHRAFTSIGRKQSYLQFLRLLVLSLHIYSHTR